MPLRARITLRSGVTAVTTVTDIGILGLGMQLPATVRHNTWWPPEIVARWAHRPAMPPPAIEVTPIVAAVISAMSSQATDPFGGSVARHVLADDEQLEELEVAAARSALARAALDPAEIDLVLTCTAPTEFQLTNSACALHARLGLRPACFTLQTDGAQYAFLLQLGLARAMIASGQARHALLVQGSAVTRLLDPESPISPMFGDGATAAVIGPVSPGRGILAAVHRTDGRLPNTLIASVPGARWYDGGRAILHMADPVGMREILLRTVELMTESIHAVLAAAGLTAADVNVLAMHQGMPWLRELVQQFTGLEHARAIETFASTAHMFSAFIPSTLVAAEERGDLRPGDLVVIAGGGNGMTYGATVARWGR